MEASKDNKYRATRLWNEIIVAVRQGLPLGRHRRYMKAYDSCFVASDAVDWVNEYLCSSPNFGSDVSRAQTVLLLQKLQKAGVIEDVRGPKYNKEPITDSSRLFRFVATSSPAKPVKTNVVRPLQGRQPLTSRSTNLVPPGPMPRQKQKAKVVEELPQCRLVANTPLTVEEIEEVWRHHTLAQLQKLLGVDTLDGIVDPECVHVDRIIHNMTQVNQHGMVTNLDKREQYPPWVLLTMKWLQHWPDHIEGSSITYPGVERDVFNALRNYFSDHTHPIVPYELYDTFIRVLACIEKRNRKLSRPSPPAATDGIASFASVESLLMNLTANAPNSPFAVPEGKQAQQRTRHHTEVPLAWLETSFSIMCNEEPKTQLLHQGTAPMPHYARYKHQWQSMHNVNGLMDFPKEYAASVNDLRNGSLPDSQRFYSMTDMHAVDPIPENTLQAKDALFSGSTAVSSHTIDASSEQLHARYGYSLFMAPRPRNHHNRTLPDAVDYAHAQRCDTFSDLNDCGLLCDEYGVFEEDGECAPPRPPPPYISPPTYQESLSRSGRSSTSTSSQSVPSQDPLSKSGRSSGSQSFASAKSHFSPETYHLLDITRTPGLDQAFVDHYEKTPNCRNLLKSDANHYCHPVSSSNSASSGHMHNEADMDISPTSSSHSNQRTDAYPNNQRVDSPMDTGYNDCQSVSPIDEAHPNERQPSPIDPIDGYMERRLSPIDPADGYLVDNMRAGVYQRAKVSPEEYHPERRCDRPHDTHRRQTRENSFLHTTMMGPLYASSPAVNQVASSHTNLKRSDSLPDLPEMMSPMTRSQLCDALQLVCLLLPPGARRKLHHLLRFMSKVSENDRLVLDYHRTNRATVISTFTSCILRCADPASEDAMAARRLVNVMAEMYGDVMKVPQTLKLQIQERLSFLRRSKMAPGCDDLDLVTSYCQQVSRAEYERQKLSTSQMALYELLESIVHDRKMGQKEKKKKLKQFQKMYPDLYARRFPTSESEAVLFPNKPKIKPPLLSRPLNKLKSIRF